MFIYINICIYIKKCFNFLSDWPDGCCWNCSTASFGIFRFTRVNLRWLKLQLRQELCESVILYSPHLQSDFGILFQMFSCILLCIPTHLQDFPPCKITTVVMYLWEISGVKEHLPAICRIPSVSYLAITLKIR